MLVGGVAIALLAVSIAAGRGHRVGLAGPAVSPGAVSVPGVGGLKAINYFPSDAGWTYMWQRWDPTHMDRDFARIADLSANAIRIAVQPSVFGWPRPNPAMETELTGTVALAAAHGLRVELLLFAWWVSYGDLANSDVWTEALLAPFHNDRRIAFVEFFNEIAPENAQAISWARHELPVVKKAAGTTPVTVSVSNDHTYTAVEALAALKSALSGDPPDFYDMHVYGPAGEAYSEMAAAKALVAPALLYIGEAGASSHVSGSFLTPALAEAAQDQDLRSVEWAAQANGLPAPAVWMYQDLTVGGVPPAAFLNQAGYQYGLFRVDGSPKPSAASVAAAFRNATVDIGFNGGFEASAGGMVTNWQKYRPGQGHLAWDPTVAHSGNASVRLSQTFGDASGTSSFFTTPIVSPLRAGQQFQLQAWAKGAFATGVNVVSVSWFKAAYAYIGASDSAPLPFGTTGWTQLTKVVQVPPGALYGEIFLKSSDNQGTVWFDDVSFTPVVSSVLPSPGSGGSATPPALLHA